MSIKSLIRSFALKSLTHFKDIFDGCIELTNTDDCVIIRILKPVHVLVDGTAEFTFNGEFSVLANGDIHLDSKTIELCGRKAKQIREMEQLVKESVLNDIGRIEFNETLLEQIEFIDLITTKVKEEVLSELRNERSSRQS